MVRHTETLDIRMRPHADDDGRRAGGQVLSGRQAVSGLFARRDGEGLLRGLSEVFSFTVRDPPCHRQLVRTYHTGPSDEATPP